LTTICSVDGCQNKSRARGYCGNHYQKWIRYRDPLHVVKYGTKQCSIEECSNKHMAKGFCEQHYGKWKRYGDPLYLIDPKETKRKISESSKGRSHSKETKRKISESNKGKNSGKIPTVETRLKIGKSNTGKKHTIESKKKMSEAKKGKKNSMYGKTSPNKGKKTSIEIRRKISEARAHQVLPKKDTKPEKYLQRLLEEKNIQFETHRNYVLRGVRILGQPDIFIEPNIVIFVDGDYWHCNPNDYFYRGKLEPGFKSDDSIPGKKFAQDKWTSDKNMNDKLKEKNFIVLRFWQSELETNPEKCIKIILETIPA